MIKWLLGRVSDYLHIRLETDPYPDTVSEVLDDNIKYRSGTNEAIERFKKSNPWKGSVQEKQDKFRNLNEELSKVYNIETPQIVFVEQFAYGCCYFPVGNLIVMEQERDGRYSVVTFLHEYGHALGKNEQATCKWSINLFRKHFPESFAKLKPKGHLLFMQDQKDEQPGTSI
jgi:hypothetical protein